MGGIKVWIFQSFIDFFLTCRASLHILNYKISFVYGETRVSADIYYLILKIIDVKTYSVCSDLPTTDVWEAADWEVVEWIDFSINKTKTLTEQNNKYKSGYLSLLTHVVLPLDFSNFWICVDLTVEVNIVSFFYFVLGKILS